MAYYMRFLVVDDSRLGLDALEAALKETDPLYAIAGCAADASHECGTLTYDGGVYAELTLNGEGAALTAEMDRLRGLAGSSRGRKRMRVLDLLDTVKQMLCVQVLWQDREHEETLVRLDPLWSWLAATYDGLIQADGEGFYDGCGLVLKTS